MKAFVALCAVVALALVSTPAARAQSNQIIPGTQVRLTLLNGLSTSVARTGDPFMAIVAEPVFVGSELVLPAGAKVHGKINSVTRPKMFSLFRGGASMSLEFNSIEVESRIFPARMSILSISAGGAQAGKRRKDLRTIEGEVVEEKQDVKTDVEDIGIGVGSGAGVGLIFSHVLRGTVIGLVGSTAYITTKKGKEVELPAQTGLLVRMDSTLSLPASLLRNAAYTTGGN
jgi:hypothetical protein